MVSILLIASLCSAYCPSYPNVKQEFAESKLVFIGKVISEEKVHESSDGYFDGINYTILVVETLRGKLGQVVMVFSENSSGRFPMETGETYLVFTSLTPDTFAGVPVYTISYCGNSGKVQEKKNALSLARKLSKSLSSKNLKSHGLQLSTSRYH
jgi:hypothetical protein